MKSVLVLLAFSSSFAFANAVNYNHNVARINGHLACDLGDQNGGTVDCTLHVAAVGELAVDMEPINDKKGNLLGYHGMDMLTGDGMNHMLSIGADAKQNIKGVALISDNRTNGETVFVANVTAFRTDKTHVAQIGPINVDITDLHAIKASLNFVVYGDPADHIIQPANRKDLTKYLLGEIQPYLATLK